MDALVIYVRHKQRGASVICASFGPNGGTRRDEWYKAGERTVDAKFPNLLLVEAPLHVVHVRVFEQRVARHLGHVVAAVELAIHDAASLLFVQAHKAGGCRK
eukprot:scaffold63682_cov75-Phaeocystis_antarctica.AAC.1